jgi:hypothetical protein
MIDLETEVEILTELLQRSREDLANAHADRAALGNICRSYHEILFETPPKDFNKVLRAIALGFATSWANEKPEARNFVTRDVLLTSPKPLHLNVTVQCIDGKSPSQILAELQEVVIDLTATLALYNPTLAEKVSQCPPDEISELLKNVALSCDRSK